MTTGEKKRKFLSIKTLCIASQNLLHTNTVIFETKHRDQTLPPHKTKEDVEIRQKNTLERE